MQETVKVHEHATAPVYWTLLKHLQKVTEYLCVHPFTTSLFPQDHKYILQLPNLILTIRPLPSENKTSELLHLSHQLLFLHWVFPAEEPKATLTPKSFHKTKKKDKRLLMKTGLGLRLARTRWIFCKKNSFTKPADNFCFNVVLSRLQEVVLR